MVHLVEQTKSLITLEDMSQHRQLNKSFHLSIAESGGVFLLGKIYEMVSNVFPDWRLYEYMFRHPELLETSLNREYLEHKTILDAIAAHDADLAAEKAANHIQNLGKELGSLPGDSGRVVARERNPGQHASRKIVIIRYLALEHIFQHQKGEQYDQCVFTTRHGESHGTKYHRRRG